MRCAAEMARRARHRPALAHEPPLALVARVAPPARLEHLALGAGPARAHAQASAISTRRTHEPAGHTVPVHTILVLPADAAASGPPAQAVSRRSLSLPRIHLTGPPAPIHTSFTYPGTTVARGLAAMKRHRPLPASAGPTPVGALSGRRAAGAIVTARRGWGSDGRGGEGQRPRGGARSLVSGRHGRARSEETPGTRHLRSRAPSQAGSIRPRAENPGAAQRLRVCLACR